MAVLEKKALSFDELEAQTALELPERETPATVVIGCLAVCVGQISIRDVDVAVANGICANVGVLAQALNNVLTLAGFSFTGQQAMFECEVKGNLNQ